ncbi:chromosome-associated kinesin KIF4A-like [Haliotis asinina]|uniref:chromosome-associated kinesin KIF4A-like n=1 Tax=Haliotis asinina TaxID=109174 RepID=UPI003531E00F
MPADKVIPVRVAVRCRPLIPKEVGEGCQLCVNFTVNEPQIVIGRDRAFTYDFVFKPSDYQCEVYENSVKPLLDSLFKGYNATVLAYGQTGSGKTFTMGGCYEASLTQDEEQMGVIPRVLRELFQGIDERKDETDFSISVSYLEIHKEDLHDLLCHPSKRECLVIREEANGGIAIAGLREVKVKSFEETMKCLSQGSSSRTTGSTAMNNTSSRSHAIFTISVDRVSKDDPEDCFKAKFHLVDLAGSERIKRTHAEGERLREGININRGLLALGNVISALGDDSQKRNHIPYRDAKLTRLLQDSLGGNSHTLMIACISPADSNMEETINTLRYADRARKIKNKPIINRDPQQQEIMRLKSLVQQLQVQMIQGGSGDVTVTVKQESSPVNSSTEYKTMLEKMKLLEEENSKLTKELQSSLDQNTINLERSIKLELSRDKLRSKLREFKTHTGVDFELLSQSIDADSNPQMKEELEKLRRLADNVRTDSEEERSDDLIDEPLEPEDDDGAPLPSTPDSRAISTQHVLKQAQMNRELQELNRLLAKKEELASQMTDNDGKMETMKKHYELSMKELETEISDLQKEKESLSHALMDAKMNSAANKISEQRRRRMQELETQIAKLKKKMVEQSKMVKLKEQSDKQVLKLNTDIQAMKQQRVKLMKQIKEDAESFRKWKQQKDKEVLQLQQKDRRRQCEIQKMQKNHEKQQTVLRRKAEEAAAANRRLKDALARQKTVMEERSKQLNKCDGSSIGNRVRAWLSQELDVQVSIREAKYHLDSLLAGRKTLAAQLADLKAKLDDTPPKKKMAWVNSEGSTEDVSFEQDNVISQITALETEIELRNIQISDLQQKIVDADQDSKGKSAWESLHTMMEAKCGLKWLLEQAVSAKADISITKTELKEAQATNEDSSQAAQHMEDQITKLKNQFESKITVLQREHESKVLFLLKKLNSVSSDANMSADQDTRERLEFQEKTIESLSELSDRLQQVTEENEGLKKQLTRAMYQGKHMALMPSISEPGSSPFLTPVLKPKTRQKKKSTAAAENQGPLTYDEFMDEWDDDPEQESDTSDEDWSRTPLYKAKTKKTKQTKQPKGKKATSQSSLNSTFSFDDDKSKDSEDTPVDVPQLKTGKSRRIFQAIESSDNTARSSDEFEKPKIRASLVKKRGSEPSDTNDSINSTMLGGGLKKKRKLHNANRSSLFTPLA